MKNRWSAISCLLIFSAFLSCTKYDDVTDPADFAVSTKKQEYKVGEEVVFNFNTGLNMILFYSGEPGKRYENRNRNMQAGNPKLVFQTSVQQAFVSNNQDSLRLMISSDLKNYDSAGVLAANWTDITSRSSKWPDMQNSVFITSDTIDLSDFNNADKVNIAFKVIGKKYSNQAQRKWVMKDLTLTNYLSDGSATPLFSTFANTGWVQVSVKNNSKPGFMAWNVGGWDQSFADTLYNTNGIRISTAYPVQFDPAYIFNTEENEDWLITSPINLKTVKPDAGVTIKNEVNAAFMGMNYVYNKIPGVYAQYYYIFYTPGVYTVTFVGINLNNNEKREVVKQLKITVTP